MKDTKKGTFVAEDLTQLLGRPIAYHRIFAHLGGDANSAVFLSQCLYWTPRATFPDGWFYKTQAEFWEETGLTRYNQETARRKWRKLGVIEEERRGQSGHVFYRVNLERLAELLRELIDGKYSQFRLLDSNISKSGNLTPPVANFPHLPLSTENTAENTTETTTSNDDDVFSYENLVAQLQAAGASKSGAARAAKTAPDEMRRRLEYLQHFTPANPGAWLCAKLDTQYTPTKEMLEAARSTESAAERSREIERATAEKQAREKAHTAATAEAKILDELLQNLPPAKQKEIAATAEAQRAALRAAGGAFSPPLDVIKRNILREMMKNER
jgi:hypothetical protein